MTENEQSKLITELIDMVKRLEKLSDQRYLSDSGFWASRELISRDDVIQLLKSKAL